METQRRKKWVINPPSGWWKLVQWVYALNGSVFRSTFCYVQPIVGGLRKCESLYFFENLKFHSLILKIVQLLLLNLPTSFLISYITMLESRKVRWWTQWHMVHYGTPSITSWLLALSGWNLHRKCVFQRSIIYYCCSKLEVFAEIYEHQTDFHNRNTDIHG